jgi:prepilin-type N-terminal cleavage/methylation domain-containing protein
MPMNKNPIANRFTKPAPGFTLTELLVVILIIAVLAGVGFPVANKMRSRAADNECLSQLRSWSSAIALYSADNSGMVECRKWNSIGETDGSVYVPYFSGDGSHDSGYQTLAKMRCCPALKGADAIAGNGNSLTAYTMTDPTGSSAGKKVAGYNLSQVKNPSRFLLMVEAMGGKAYLQTAGEVTSRIKPLTKEPDQRHKEGLVNALMGDFSVTSFTGSDVDKNATIWTTYN